MRDWWTGTVLLLLTCAVPLFCFSIAAEDQESKPPVDATNAKQGHCPRKQLATDRGCLVPPKLTKKRIANFPKSAWKDRREGKVTLRAIVELDGTVGGIEVAESTSPGFGFEDAAIEALKQWRYKPGRIGDETVRVGFTVTMEFTLR